MKKPKIVALALIVSIMLVGAGYAAWSETLTFNNSVSTGNSDMKFTFVEIKRGSKLVDVNQILSPNKKYIHFDIINMYPGSKYYTFMQQENTGSIPVIFDNIKIDIDKHSKDELVKKFKVSCCSSIINKDSKLIKRLKPIIDIPLNLLEKELNDIFIGVTLSAGQSIALGSDQAKTDSCFRFKLDESAENTTESSNINFSICINWKQGVE